MKRRSFLFSLLAFVGAGSFFVSRAERSKYHKGVLSDHFDGSRFFDPDGSPPKSMSELFRWNRESRENKQPWPSFVESKLDIPPAQAKFRLSYIGHASFLYQIEGVNILIDPVYSDFASPVTFAGPKRVNRPGIEFAALPPIDYVIITHNHYDHLDIATLERLAIAHKCTFICPLGNEETIGDVVAFERIKIMDWGESLPLKNGISLDCVSCRHWSARGLFDRNKALWAAFVLRGGFGNILHIGDTGYGTGIHFKRLREKYHGFKLAIIPIGAYEPRWFMKDQHVNPEEAVKIMRDINTNTAIASHWGTFQLTDEARDAPLIALKETGVSLKKFVVLEVGESYSKAL